MQIRDFIPPIVSKAVRLSRSQPALKRFQSYQQALAESDSYEAADIIEVVSRKTKAFQKEVASRTTRVIDDPLTLQSVFVMSYLNPGRSLNVLELGGACGAAYFELSHLLPGRFADWRIVETQAMSVAGKRDFQNETLKFFVESQEAVNEISSRDLLFAQGVLQYTPDPLQTLKDLFSLDFAYVYITRTPVVDSNNFRSPVIFNAVSDLSAHGPGKLPVGIVDRTVTTPCTIILKSSLVECAAKKYRQEFWFDELARQQLLIGSQELSTRNVGCLFART
jgi:putative methyltransferase (TIGR04325 family)